MTVHGHDEKKQRSYQEGECDQDNSGASLGRHRPMSLPLWRHTFVDQQEALKQSPVESFLFFVAYTAV